MRENGFQYTAIAYGGRQVQNFLWLPAAIPQRFAEPLARFILQRSYVRLIQLEQEPGLSLRVPPDSVAIFVRRLAVMVGAGISLHAAINFLSDSEDDKMNLAANRLLKAIETGHSFAGALARMPGVFPATFLGFARSGEASGRLVQALESMAVQMERSMMLKRRLKGSLAYPFFLMLGAVVLSLLLVFGIVPQMAPALEQMGVQLPALTRWMLAFTQVGTNPLVVVPFVAANAALSAVAIFTMSQTGRFTRTRRRVDMLWLQLPVISRVSQQYASTRVLSAAAMSVETGIAVTSALTEACTLAGNIHLEERILAIVADIADGSPLETALNDNEAFTRAETQVLICGSEAGDLSGAMASMARYAEDELDNSISAMTALIEPVILGFMSVVVGIVSLATFLPWISLLQSIL